MTDPVQIDSTDDGNGLARSIAELGQSVTGAAAELQRIVERMGVVETEGRAASERARGAELQTTEAIIRTTELMEQLEQAHRELTEVRQRAAAAEERAAASERGLVEAVAASEEADRRSAAAALRADEADERTAVAERRASDAEHYLSEAEERVRAAEERASASERRATDAEHYLSEAEQRIAAAERELGAAREQARTAEDQTRAAQELMRAADENARTADDRARAAEETARADEERARSAEETARTADDRARAAEESQRGAAERVRAAEERTQSAEDRMRIAEERSRDAERRAAEIEQREHDLEQRAGVAEQRVAIAEQVRADAEARAAAAERRAAEAERRASDAEVTVRMDPEAERRAAEAEERLGITAERARRLEEQVADLQAALETTMTQIEEARATTPGVTVIVDQERSALQEAVAAEVRRPLTSILGLALALKHHDPSSNDGQEMVRQLGANARKLDRLVSELVDLDKLVYGTLEPTRRRTDLEALVRRVVEEIPDLANREVFVSVQHVAATIDPILTEQIVESLLSNAGKRTGAGETVWVELGPEAGGALICVDDDGAEVPTGIRRSSLDALREDAGDQPPHIATGIALVSRLAEIQGGRAWTQERQGGGTSFRVFLPDTSTNGAASPEDGSTTLAPEPVSRHDPAARH